MATVVLCLLMILTVFLCNALFHEYLFFFYCKLTIKRHGISARNCFVMLLYNHMEYQREISLSCSFTITWNISEKLLCHAPLQSHGISARNCFVMLFYNHMEYQREIALSCSFTITWNISEKLLCDAPLQSHGISARNCFVMLLYNHMECCAHI